MGDLPEFKSVEEMMKFAEKMNFAEKKQKSESRKKQKENKKKSLRDASEDELIYEVLHMYTRPGDNFAAVKQDAQTRYKMQPDTFWVHVHNHNITQDCSNSCDWLEREV